MQIVIKIPDALYDTCKITSKMNGENEIADILIDAVGNGTPLDNILNKIRAKIEEIHLIGYATVYGKREIASRAVIQILDKYKTESEVEKIDSQNNE